MGVTYTHPQGTPNNGQRRSVIAGDGSARVRIYNTNLPGGTYYTGGVYIVGGEYSGASYDGSTLTLSGTTVAGYGGQPGTAGGQTAYWSANWGSGSWSGGYGGYVTWAYSAPGAPNAPSVSRSSNGTSLTATTGGGSGRITYYNVALNGVTGWNANGTTFSVGAHTTYTVISLAGNEDNSTQGGSTTSYGIPNSPGTPSVSPNTSVSGRIDVSWSAPSYVGGGILEYHVYRNGSYVNTTTSTSYADTGLTPGSSYSYTVYARNSTGWGPVSGTSSAATANGVPSAPNSFSVTNNTSVPGRIDLAWSAPSTVYTGVTSYKIYRDDAFLTSTTSTSYANTGLNYNTSYSYYVRAVNSIGEGSATSTLSALTTGIPTSPRNFTATPLGTASDTGKIKLDWIAPDPATTYGTVTAYTLKRGTTQIYSGTDLTFTDTGLTAGTTYTYTVTVTNSSNLTSPEVSASAMAPGVPSAPRTFTATPNSTVAGRIDLAWIAPATINGTITGYDVYRKLSTDANYPGTPTTVINGAATLSQTYTGLTLGATYNFKVVARNAFADSSGLRSAEATATAMAPTVPSAPLNVVATSSASVSGRIDLSWVTPSATNGTITGYDIYYKLTSASSYPSTPNKTTTGTSTVTDITGLTVGSYYDFKIKARNSFADTSGNRSDFSDAATNALAPGLANAPVLSSATPSLTKLGEVTLSWAAPTIPAGTITQYYVYATISGQSPVLWASVSGTTTSTTLTGLAQRQTYSFSVRAVNGWPTASPGTSPASNSIDARSPGAALAPTNLTASVPTNLSGTVNLSWTAPTDVGATGASIVGYGVYFSDNAVIVENTGSATTNYQVTGLVPNIEYYFYVRALNTISALPNNEDGIKSSTIGATPVGAPKAPLSPFITTSTSVAGRLTIGWSANPAETTSITGYNVFYADGTFVGTTTGTTLVVDNLSSDITYSFYIKARNLVTDTAGITGGDSSTTVSARPGSTSTQALPTTVTVTNNTNTVLTGQSTVTSLTSNTVSFSKSASDIPSASVPASASSVLTNNTNTIINGTYSVVSTPTTDKITYNRVGPNFSSTSTPSGTATNTTNAVFSGTHDITDINVDNKTISYNKTASTVTSRAVPLTPLATVSNTTSTVYNANNASITAVTEDTFSYAKTNANIEESIATGTVVNNTNRYIYNGTYTVTGVPAYNEFTYSTGDDVSRVNLAINPSMERVGTGTNILRTNHYTNPRMANSTAGWTILAPGATQTPDVNGTRIDFSDDVAPLEAFFYETSAMPIATGEYAVASIELTVPPGYPSLKLKSTLRSYGAGDAEVKTITVGTGQTVRLDSGVYLTSTTSSGVRNLIGATETIPAGARLVVRNAIFEKTNILGEYFDGASTDAKGWDFAWSGTADASKSYAKAQAVVVRKNEITNPGLEATSTGELVRTNIITNPSFEAALTGWTDSSTGMTSSRTTSQAYSGAASLQMISTLTNAYSISPAMSVSASNTYTASAWVKGTSGKLVGITIRELNSGGSTVGDTNSSNFTLNGSWQRISVTRNLTSAAVSAQVLLIDRTASNAGQTFYADDILFEDSAFLGDYFSGATADGYGLNYAWTGTVDASTSTATTSSVYATNLATNPSGEAVQSGTVVLRTNLLDNPTPSETGSTDWAITSPGTGGVYSVTYEADGFTALTTTQPSDANFTIQIGATSGLTGRIPVEAGKTYTVSATVVSSINDVRSTGMVWYSATGANLGVVYSTKRSLVANVPQRLWHTAVAPAGAVSATIVVVSSGGSGLSSQIRTVGSTISAKEALFEQTDQLREYFSGATTDALGWAYDWTGLANESSSTAKAQSVSVRNNLLTNPSMESTQTGLLVATNLVTNPSMETTSGTVTVRTNLATNPSMETVSTGTTVLRTNLVTNPSIEVDTTGWSLVQPTTTISRDTANFYSGVASLKVVTAGTNASEGPYFNSYPSGLISGQKFSAAAWVKAPSGTSLRLFAQSYGTGNILANNYFTATGSWQYVKAEGATAGASLNVIVGVITPSAQAVTFYVDSAIIEIGTSVGDYFDGSTTDSLGWDYAWSGTANASTSTASALSTIVRENLVTNPAMESVTSGSTVLRTNLMYNASMISSTGVMPDNMFAYVGGTASGTRTTVSGSSATSLTGVSLSATGNRFGTAYDVVAGTLFGLSQTMTVSATVSGLTGANVKAVFYLDFKDNLGLVGSAVAQGTANGRISFTTTSLSRIPTGYVAYVFLESTSGAVTGAGATFSDLLIENTSVVGPFFSGATTDALGWDYAWGGASNASVSTAAAAAVDVRTNLATNPSMETVSPGTTVHRRNLIPNPNFEVDTTDWVAGSSTISRDTVTYYSGVASLKVVCPGSVTGEGTYKTNSGIAGLNVGQSVSASAWVKAPVGAVLEILVATQGAGASYSATAFTGTGQWQFVKYENSIAGASRNPYVIVRTRGTAQAVTFYVDNVIMELGSVVGDYFDGSTTDSLGWDYAWSGTAGNSISTAAASTVTTRTNLITNPSMETSSTGELVRTNLATNPSMEDSGQIPSYFSVGNTSKSQSSTYAYSGTYSGKYVKTVAGPMGAISHANPSTVSAGQTYTLSFYVYSTIASSVRAELSWMSGVTYPGNVISTLQGTYISVPANTWTRVSVTGVAPATTTNAVFSWYSSTTFGLSDALYLDAVLIEASAVASDYFDGSSIAAEGLTYAWTGTANASTSTAVTSTAIATNLVTNPSAEGVTTGTDTTKRINLVTNPSFETGTTGWSGGTSSGAVPTISVDSTAAYVGTQSLKVVATTAAFQGANITASGLTIGSVYKLSAWIYIPRSGGFAGVQATTAGIGVGPTVSTTGVWTRATYSFTATATSHAVGVVSSAAVSIGQYFYVDAVLLEAASSTVSSAIFPPYFDGDYSADPAYIPAWTGTVGTSTSTALARGVSNRENLVRNPSFEVDTTGWSQAGGATISRDTVTVASGVGSLKVVAGAGTYTGAAFYLSLKPGVTYTYSAYVYAPSGMQINFAGDAIGVNTTLVGNGAWQRVSVTGVGNTNTTAMFIRAIAANAGTFYVDNVMLEETSVLNPYFDGSRTNMPGWTTSWSGTANYSRSVATALPKTLWTNIIPNPSMEAVTPGGTVVRRNYVTNPGVEYDTTGWSFNSAGALARSTAVAHEGKVSLLITRSGTTDDFATITMSGLTPGERYVGSFWAYITGNGATHSDRGILVWGNPAGTGGTSNSVNYDRTKINQWQRVYADAVVSSAGQFQIRAYAMTGFNVFIDSVQLERGTVPSEYFDGSSDPTKGWTYAWTGTPGASISTASATASPVVRTNLLTNPSFESGATTNWSSNAASGLVVSTAQRYVGTQSMLLTANGGGSFGPWFARTAITAGETYTYSIYILDVNTSVQYTAAFEWYNSSGGFISTTTGTATTVSTSAWTRVTVTGVAPAGAVTTTGVAYSATAPVSGRQAYFDAALLERAAAVGDYFDGSYSSTADFSYAWTGTANASTSTQIGALVGPNVGSSGAASVWQSNQWSASGTKSLAVTRVSTGDAYATSDISMTSPGGKTYTALLTVRANVATTADGTMGLQESGGSFRFMGIFLNTGAAIAAGTTTIRITFTAPADAISTWRMIYRPSTKSQEVVWYDNLLLVEGTYTGDYFDGNTVSPDSDLSNSWVAAPYSSASVNRGVGVNNESNGWGNWVGYQTSSGAKYGDKAFKGIATAANTVLAGMSGVPLTAGTTYTFQFWVKPSVTSSWRVTANTVPFATGNAPFVSCPANVWTLVSHTTRITVSGTYNFWANTENTMAAGSTWLLDGFLVTPGTYTSSYFDGWYAESLDRAVAWTGNTHASTSSLTASPVTDWTGILGAYAYRSDNTDYLGTYSAKVVCSGTVAGQGLGLVTRKTAAASSTYTASVWVLAESGKNVQIELEEWTTAGGYVGSTLGTSTAGTGAWMRLSVTRTFGSTGTRAEINVKNVAAVAHNFYVDAALLEASDTLQSYFDGTFLPAGDFSYAWVGTADASQSIQRAAVVAGVTALSICAAVQSFEWDSTGAKSLRLVPTSTTANNSWVRFDIPTVIGTSYTAQVKMRLTQALTGSLWPNSRRINVYNTGLSVVIAQSSQATNAAGVYDLTVTFTAEATATPILIGSGARAGNGDVWIDDFIVEKTSTIQGYFDGSTGSYDAALQRVWTGAAHASASVIRGALPVAFGGPNNSSAVLTSERSYSGDRSTKVFYAAGNTGGVGFNYLVSLTTGTTYTASAWVYTPTGSILPRFNIQSPGFTTVSGTAATLYDTWERISVTFTTNSTATYYIYILNSAATTAGQFFYVDNFVLEAASAVLPYFDGATQPDLSGDTVVTWTGTAQSSTSRQLGAGIAGWTSSQARSQSYSGSASMVCYSTSVQSNGQYTWISVSPSTTYTASAWVKAEVGKLFRMRLMELNGGSYIGENGTVDITGTGSWQRVSVTSTFGASANTARIYFENRTTGAHTFYVDAVLLEASPVVQDYFDGSITSADADLTNSWSGTAHASTSVMRGTGVVGATVGGSNTPVSSTIWSSSGSKSLRIFTPVGGSNNDIASLNLTVGTTYTIQAKIYIPTIYAGTPTLLFGVRTFGGSTAEHNTAILNQTGVQSLSVTFTVSSGTTSVSPRIWVIGATGLGQIFVDNLIVVQGNYTGEYFDGNTEDSDGLVLAWTGAANASTSTATTGTLYATNRVLNPSMETVASGATTLRTNLVTNPNMEVVAWPGYGSGSGATLSTIQSYIGTQSTKTAPTLSGLKGITLGSFLPVIGGAKYTFSAWVYRESGSSTISPLIEWIDAGSTYISSSSSTAVTVPVGAWTRVFVTATAPANATQVALDVLFNAAVAGSDVMYVDAILLEQTDQLREYFDGATADALGWDYAWSGTANASSSTAKATPVAIRTNLSVNPRAIATVGGWSPNGAAQSVTKGITPPVAHPLGITTSARSNLNSGQTSPTALSMYNIDTLSNTGPQRSIGVWVLAMASGYKAYFYGQSASVVTLTSGVWAYVQTTTAIAANTHMSLYVEKITGNADPADMIYVTGCVVEASTTAPSSYFDGSIGALEDGYYTTWSGTANASTSVQYGVAPQGWAISNGPGAFTSLSRGQDSDGTKFIRYNRPTNDTVGTWRVMSYTYSGMFDNLNIGTYVTLLLKVRASASTGLNFGVLRGDGIPGGNYGSSQTIGTSWSWVRYYVPLTTNNQANMWMYSGFPMGTGSYVDIAEALAVVGKYTGPYFTGAIDPDVDSTVAWTGTAHASTSTLSVTPVRNWIGTYGAVVHQSSLQTKDSSYAAKVYCNGDASIQGTQLFTRSSVSASTQYTASAWVLGESGKTIRIDLQELTSAGVLVGTTSSADIATTGSWQRISVTRTMGATASTANVAVSNIGAVTHTFYLDASQLEYGPVASDYFDGDSPSLGDFQYLWNGTANQSTSTQRGVQPAGVSSQLSLGAGISSLEWASAGSKSIRIIPTSSSPDSFVDISSMLPAPSTLAGKICTFVGKVRIPQTLTGTLDGRALRFTSQVNLSTGGTAVPALNVITSASSTAGIYEVRQTFTMPATATTWSYARLYNGASAGSGEVFWDDFALVEGAYTGQTFSGDTADTDDFAFAWDGTPHASTSTFAVNPATNWTGVNGAVIYQTAVEKYIGTHSGQVSCSGSVGLQGARLISRSTVSASTLYYASAWVKGTVGKTLRIELQEYTATGTYIGGTASSNVTATGSWQRISVSRTMGSTGTRADVVISNVAATSHNFYVDAVMLEAASSLQNYFDGNYPASGDFSYTWNGTAEASTSQYQAPSVGSTSATGAYAIQSSQWESNGTRSLRVISTTAATNSASVNFTPFITSGLEPGKTYTVKAKVYRAQAGARVGLLAYHGYVATTLTQNVSANIPTTVGTHSISITFTVGLTIEDARLLIFSNQVAGAADIWIDDFFIVEGEYTGDYFDGDTTGTGGAFPILYNWQGTPHNSSSIRDVGGNAPAGGAAILSPYGDAERVNSTAALEIQYRSGWLG